MRSWRKVQPVPRSTAPPRFDFAHRRDSVIHRHSSAGSFCAIICSTTCERKRYDTSAARFFFAVASVHAWGAHTPFVVQSNEPVGIVPLRGSVVREAAEREINYCMEIRPDAFKGAFSSRTSRPVRRVRWAQVSLGRVPFVGAGLPTFYIYAESREDYQSWLRALVDAAQQSSLNSSLSSIEKYSSRSFFCFSFLSSIPRKATQCATGELTNLASPTTLPPTQPHTKKELPHSKEQQRPQELHGSGVGEPLLQETKCQRASTCLAAESRP